jgi:hypothetical protein
MDDTEKFEKLPRDMVKLLNNALLEGQRVRLLYQSLSSGVDALKKHKGYKEVEGAMKIAKPEMSIMEQELILFCIGNMLYQAIRGEE